MKIFNWNCGGAFRKKFDHAFSSNSDIYIIQECESIEKFKDIDAFSAFNIHWKGANKNKGLAVISKKDISIESLAMDENYRGRQLKWFLPLSVNKTINLTAVWTHKAEAEAFAYIGQFYWFLKNNLDQISNPIFIGDFNSNSIWDSWDRWWNHSDIVNLLEKKQIKSIYHNERKEKQGAETIKTFFHRKKLDKGYHIDYIFAANKFANSTRQLEVGTPDDWLQISDHVPLIWEFDEKL